MATHVIDVEVFDTYGGEEWAQAKYLVHGHDDVYWTNSAKDAAGAWKSLSQIMNPSGSR